MNDLVLHDIVVLVFLYLGVHGAEVHGRVDEVGVTGGDGVRHRVREKPIDVLAEKCE